MRLIPLDDTIVAISTPIGHGGIGIVRLSGKKAVLIAEKMFACKDGAKPSQFKSYTMHFGWIIRRHQSQDAPARQSQTPGRASHKTQNQRLKTSHGSRDTGHEIIDEVLLTVMHGPKSYTGEDIVEISCHGGIVPMRAILQLALDYGARLAEPGEFTKRAFLNGRMDLTQAEAVLDIIQAKTDAFLKVSIGQLKGELTTALESIREALMTVYTHMEAIVNFPEDEINAADKRQFLTQTKAAGKRVNTLLQTGEQGKILKEGIKVVICGKPNVGKSSLLNVLLKQPRAIVTDVAGTTRDTIEETAQIKGIPFQLIDTAGILRPRDSIEREAIKRSHLSIEQADLILFVLDAGRVLSSDDRVLAERIKDKNVLVVVNKCDLKMKLSVQKVKMLFKGKAILKVSALKKIAISNLEDTIVKNVWHGKVESSSRVLVSNARHIEALKNCVSSIERAQDGFSRDLPFELIAEEIKTAVRHLDQITGRDIDSDLIDKIFSEFCIGK